MIRTSIYAMLCAGTKTCQQQVTSGQSEHLRLPAIVKVDISHVIFILKKQLLYQTERVLKNHKKKQTYNCLFYFNVPISTYDTKTRSFNSTYTHVTYHFTRLTNVYNT